MAKVSSLDSMMALDHFPVCRLSQALTKSFSVDKCVRAAVQNVQVGITGPWLHSIWVGQHGYGRSVAVQHQGQHL